MDKQTTLVIFSVMAAAGLVGLVAIDGLFMAPQEAEAKGCINPNAPGGGSIAFNASKGRCVQP